MPEPSFNKDPILNSPYEEPKHYWVLDDTGMPTGEVADGRRESKFLTPIAKATQTRRQKAGQLNLQVHDEQDNAIVNTLREEIQKWREKPLRERGISGITERLLAYWQEDHISPRPFFCQIEAVETLIWLNEIAPRSRKSEIQDTLKKIEEANGEANRGLPRLAAKMATGAGKTTVMAMLIAYHAINKARSPRAERYSDQFLIITPGITIKDRLRVLLPQDTNNYYEKHKIVPPDMLADVRKATVIITNYHALKQRETMNLTKQQRELLKGNDKEDISTVETPGQMLQRVCPELLRRQSKVVVINDEAHHCYIHKQGDEGENKVVQDEKEEAERNKEAARLWINGIIALGEKRQISAVYDLSATPFFLRGSGYPEGRLFPWVVSDFSLMDAIESGIVKLPRVPVKDATTKKQPINRDLYEHIRKKLPKKGAGKQGKMDPQKIPSELSGALQTLYSAYEKTSTRWDESGIGVPPVFIIVCNNTSTSKLVYDYISGYEINGQWRRGEFELFNNVNEQKSGLLPRPRTLLIDSYQLESGDALSKEFKEAAAAEIATFKEEMRIRDSSRDISKINDADLLREVMNTVGKKEKLGEQVRCVVSVSMLTEGWDTNNVTHILGVRAFGTQLLCEQVVGRALRRINYEPREGKETFPPEYAEVMGVPFNFAKGDGDPPLQPNPHPQQRIRHLDARKALEITFPRVSAYRIKPPEERLTANFDDNSHFVIDADMAPPVTETAPIVGEGIHLNLDALKERRINEVAFSLAAYIVQHYYKEQEGGIAPGRFGDMLPIVRHWLQHYVKCLYGTCVQYLLWQDIAKQAAECIYRACTPTEEKSDKLLPVLDPFTREGSTIYVDYLTRKKRLHETTKSHINYAVCDSNWEVEFCKLLERTPKVVSYARNEGLHLEVPYVHDEKEHKYLPDYIILIDDGHGKGDLLNLVVEIKGYRNQQAQAKADTMKRLWIPAVNNHGGWGRWAFDEILDPQRFHPQLTGKYELPEIAPKAAMSPVEVLAKYTSGKDYTNAKKKENRAR